MRLQLLLVTILPCAAGCQSFHPLDAPGILRYAERNSLLAQFPLPGVQMEIAAHDTLDRSLEVFDCDLPRAGIHPVWLRVRNSSSDSILLENSHISLTDSQGHAAAHPAAPALVVEHLYRSYKTRFYSLHYRQELENRYEEMQLKPVNLQPGQEVAGYLFFLFEDKRHGSLQGDRLVWAGIRSTKDNSAVMLEYAFPAP